MRNQASRLLVCVAPAVLMAFVQPADSHDSWISRNRFRDPLTGQWCCNEHDCNILSVDNIRQFKDSFEITIAYFGEDKKFVVPNSRILPSLDGRYWACLSTETVSRGRGVRIGVRCFFAPLDQ